MSIDLVLEGIKKKIDETGLSVEVSEVGRVIEIADGIAKVSGISSCQSSEMLQFQNGTYGIALNLEQDSLGVIIVGDYLGIKEGDEVKRTGKILEVPVGDKFLGRIVDSLGVPLDGKGAIKSDAHYKIEKIAPGVMTRQAVTQPLQTGIKSIDALTPIGRGQRQLIIGDRQTGKTALAIDTILNQKGKNVVCIYVAVSQKESKVARIVQKLQDAGAMDYTAVVLAGASKPAAYSFLAPYSGTSLAEYFMDQGKDVLVVYDDLSKHAVAYREISLLLRRPPGREAYPGDIFYLHSRLLERSCRRNKESGGGSITSLPIIETQAGDISAYIPTNVISITDGQIFLQSNLFFKGIRPAINVGISVSRVGSAAQIKSIKKTVGKLKLDLAQYRELEAFAQFASDLDPATKKALDRGIRATEYLKQPQYSPVPVALQAALAYAVNNGYIDSIDPKDVGVWEKELTKFLNVSHSKLLEKIEQDWSPEIEGELKKVLDDFKI
jgi:F-type H+-transporting ATPase subunit alpha